MAKTPHPFVASPGTRCSSCNALRSDGIHNWRERPLDERIRKLITDAEAVLGPLSTGQRVDLVLDNFQFILNTREARSVLALHGLLSEPSKSVQVKEEKN